MGRLPCLEEESAVGVLGHVVSLLVHHPQAQFCAYVISLLGLGCGESGVPRYSSLVLPPCQGVTAWVQLWFARVAMLRSGGNLELASIVLPR